MSQRARAGAQVRVALAARLTPVHFPCPPGRLRAFLWEGSQLCGAVFCAAEAAVGFLLPRWARAAPSALPKLRRPSAFGAQDSEMSAYNASLRWQFEDIMYFN